MINGEMVTLAREAAGLTQGELALRVALSQATISKIEGGLHDPTNEQLSSLVQELGIPEAFFSQADQIPGAGLTDIFHRKRQTLPAKVLRRARAEANIVRLQVLRLFSGIELDAATPLPAYPIDEHLAAAEVAQRVRAVWRIAPGPFPDLIAAIESTGTPVVFMRMGSTKLSAISLQGDVRPIVVVNSMLPFSHCRWSLAHEVGHLVLHGRAGGDEQLEDEANRFADELLLPAADIRRYLRDLRFDRLGDLKRVWRVSIAALIRRAHTLGEISDRQYRTFNMKRNDFPGGRNNEPGEFPAEEPRLIRSIVNFRTDELGFTLAQVADLMCTTAADVRERYFDEVAHPPLRLVRSDGPVHRAPAPSAS